MGTDSFNQPRSAGRQGLLAGAVPVSQRVQFFVHGADEILMVNFSRANVPMMKAVVEECQRVVASRPYASVKTLVDVEAATFDKDVIEIMGKLAKHNRPYVVKSAVIGVTGLRQIAFNAIMGLAQREMKLFDSREEALEWLVG